MFTITKEIQFDAGHRVPLHASKCRNPHGHRYRVVAHVRGELITEGPESGMVKDFSYVKAMMTEHIHDVFDHGFVIQYSDDVMKKALGLYYDPEHMDYVNVNDWKVIIVDTPPTAECFAELFFRILKNNGMDQLIRIDVYETPTSMASYEED